MAPYGVLRAGCHGSKAYSVLYVVRYLADHRLKRSLPHASNLFWLSDFWNGATSMLHSCYIKVIIATTTTIIIIKMNVPTCPLQGKIRTIHHLLPYRNSEVKLFPSRQLRYGAAIPSRTHRRAASTGEIY